MIFGRHNTVIAGDSPSDVEAGITGGAKVIGVASGTSGVKELRAASAATVVDGLDSEQLRVMVGRRCAVPPDRLTAGPMI